MHVHTNYSDSKASVLEVIEAAKNKGLDGMAITDHHTLLGAKEAMSVENDLVIIPGEEVRTDRGEILAFGIKELVPKELPIEEAIRMVHLQNGLVFIPHPTVPFFGKLKESEMSTLPIDGLEVFSAISPLAGHYASKNIAMAERLGFSMIASSDSHFPETVGDAYTIIDAEDRSLSSILEAIKGGKTETCCRSSKMRFKIRMLKYTIGFLFRKNGEEGYG